MQDVAQPPPGNGMAEKSVDTLKRVMQKVPNARVEEAYLNSIWDLGQDPKQVL